MGHYPPMARRSAKRVVTALIVPLAVAASLVVAVTGASAAPLDDAFRFADGNHDALLKDWVSLVAIKAPSGGEAQREAWVAAKLQAIGLTGVTTDAKGNVVGYYPGKAADAPTLLLVAHTDTAYAAAAAPGPTVNGDWLVGPGADGDTSGLVAAIYSLAAMRAAGVVPDVNVVFLASVQGSGWNRAGMSYFLDNDHAPVNMVVEANSVRGIAGEIEFGSTRWDSLRMRLIAPSDGSGNPASAASLAAAGAQVGKRMRAYSAALTGCGVEALVGDAGADVFVSFASKVDDATTTDLEDRMIAEAAATAQANGTQLMVPKPYWHNGGITLPGARTHALTQAAASAAKEVGLAPILFDSDTSSLSITDKEAAIARGLYAVSVAVTNRGTVEGKEAAQISPIFVGTKWLVDLVMKLH